jgi:hypothetical protein
MSIKDIKKKVIDESKLNQVVKLNYKTTQR